MGDKAPSNSHTIDLQGSSCCKKVFSDGELKVGVELESLWGHTHVGLHTAAHTAKCQIIQ